MAKSIEEMIGLAIDARSIGDTESESAWTRAATIAQMRATGQDKYIDPESNGSACLSVLVGLFIMSIVLLVLFGVFTYIQNRGGL